MSMREPPPPALNLERINLFFGTKFVKGAEVQTSSPQEVRYKVQAINAHQNYQRPYVLGLEKKSWVMELELIYFFARIH